MKRQLIAGAVALSLALAACSGGGDDDSKVSATKKTTTTRASSTSGTSVDNTTTSGAAAPGATTTTRRSSSGGTPATTGGGNPGTTGTPGVVDGVKATKVATLSSPVSLAVRPSEPGHVYIAQKTGQVRRLTLGGAVDGGTVLDLSDRISTGNEQGLLSITFSPDSSRLYAYYTDRGGSIQVSAFPVGSNSESKIITIPHPNYGNHNGGTIAFGTDGYLYISTGDGGGGGDPDNNAQNLNSLLGKMLRIAPGATGYTSPSDNPFAKKEIWHYGLRNPWRWSFDKATNEMWIADVGQNEYEEVNRVGAGAKGVNFGWDKREGTHSYDGGSKPAGAVDPVYETSHSAGNCSITGGYVYRGSAIRGFAGTYVFGDYCKGQVTAAAGNSMRELGIKVDALSSFGQDANNELWVLSLNGGVFKLERK